MEYRRCQIKDLPDDLADKIDECKEEIGKVAILLTLKYRNPELTVGSLMNVASANFAAALVVKKISMEEALNVVQALADNFVENTVKNHGEMKKNINTIKRDD